MKFSESLAIAPSEEMTTEVGAVFAGAGVGMLIDDSIASSDSKPKQSYREVDSAGLSAGAMAPMPLCEATGCVS